ncbi:MAG: hypothetical protein EBT09_12900 [Actinobacteria bacterium]|nr:hypothetical protein [Actinomycetota bacterium]
MADHAGAFSALPMPTPSAAATELGEDQRRNEGRLARLGVDVGGEHHVLHPGADVGGERADPHQTEVA